MKDQLVYDVAIVGGGIIGLACAFELARRRHRVIVIERDRPGQHASRVAAGLLGTASLPVGENAELFPLKLDSLRRYPEFIAKVEPIGRKSAGYRMDGTLGSRSTRMRTRSSKRYTDSALAGTPVTPSRCE